MADEVEQSARDSVHAAIQHLKTAYALHNNIIFLESLTDALEEINNAMACTTARIRKDLDI